MNARAGCDYYYYYCITSDTTLARGWAGPGPIEGLGEQELVCTISTTLPFHTCAPAWSVMIVASVDALRALLPERTMACAPFGRQTATSILPGLAATSLE